MMIPSIVSVARNRLLRIDAVSHEVEVFRLGVPVHAELEGITLVGDEALMLRRKTGCPMVVGPGRAAAARVLLERSDCDIILSDDGLQHYALHRDIEIAVIDGARRFVNGLCLPAGPLREPVTRLR